MIGKNMMDLSLLRWYMDFLVKLIDDLNMKAYFIEEGEVNIFKKYVGEEEEKEIFIASLGSPDVFGESCLFEEKTRNATVKSSSETILIKFYKFES